MDILTSIVLGAWGVLVDSAIYILFGFFIAGLLKAFLPSTVIAKHLGTGHFGPVFKAALFGVPLPLCSCGVIPAAAGLRTQGASKGATTSFLIATPETGVDSISITWGLLDPIMAVVRPLSAFITAVAAGLAVDTFDSTAKEPAKADATESVKSSCCCESEKPATPVTSSCGCSSEKPMEPIKSSCCCESEKPAEPIVSSCGCSSEKTNDPAPASSCSCASQAKQEGQGGFASQMFSSPDAKPVQATPITIPSMTPAASSCGCETEKPAVSTCACGHERPAETTCACDSLSETKTIEASACSCNTEPKPAVSSCGCSTEIKPVTSSCGCSTEIKPVVSSCGCSTEAKPATSSCGCSDTPAPANPSLGERFMIGMRFAFGKLIADIGKWLLLGIILASLIAVFIPEDMFTENVTGFAGMVVMMIIGVPMYVCATASTPIAAAFALKGLSPGAALVFLLAGPATNMATITVVAKMLGKRAAIIYVSTIAITSLVIGVIVNMIYAGLGLNVSNWVTGTAHEHHTILSEIAACILVALVLYQWSKAWLAKRKGAAPASCCSGK